MENLPKFLWLLCFYSQWPLNYRIVHIYVQVSFLKDCEETVFVRYNFIDISDLIV